MKTQTSAYAALLKESRARKMPDGFATDLVEHDRKRLDSEHAPDRFGWVLRMSGTLLLDASMSDMDRLGYFDHITKSGRDDSDRCYFWDGSQLASVTARIMCERMAPHALPHVSQSTEARSQY